GGQGGAGVICRAGGRGDGVRGGGYGELKVYFGEVAEGVLPAPGGGNPTRRTPHHLDKPRVAARSLLGGLLRLLPVRSAPRPGGIRPGRASPSALDPTRAGRQGGGLPGGPLDDDAFPRAAQARVAPHRIP